MICEQCGTENPERYQNNGYCKTCAKLAAIDFYNKAVSMGIPTRRVLARKYKLDAFATRNPCKRFGHVGLLLTHNRACKECLTTKTPRQQAEQKGLTWYLPTRPCKNGHIAPRSVYSGQCKECIGKMAHSQKEAKEKKQRYYFNGSKCKRGHVGPRYAGNNNCVLCARR